MPRPTTVLICTLGFLVGLCAAEGTGTTEVTVSKRGNVRFAPTLKAGVILTMDKGATVRVYGPVEANEDWYAIAFPRKGYAWVHERHLQKIDEPDVFEVITDETAVRSDSRVNSTLVDQLAIGEEVILTGKQVGRWRSIWPGNARAYMHKSVLALGSDERERIDDKRERKSKIQKYWEATKEVYRDYSARFNRDQSSALDLDWEALSDRLQRVIDEHPSITVRLDAQRLHQAIKRVVSAAKARVASGVVVTDEASDDDGDAGGQGTGSTADAGEDDAEDTGERAAADDDSDDAEDVEPLEVDAGQLAELREPPGYLKGWVLQNREKVQGTMYHLADKHQNVVAYLEVREGSSIDLGRDFYWKRVGIKGDTRKITIDGEEREMVLVKEIRLLDR